MLPVLRLLINTSWADRGIHHWPGIPPIPSFSPPPYPLPFLAYKLAGVVGVNQRGIMSQHPQQEVHLMKSLVIYVWGRLEREESGTQISLLLERWPLLQNRRKKQEPRDPAPTHSPCQGAHTPFPNRSLMGSCTRPLTHRLPD